MRRASVGATSSSEPSASAAIAVGGATIALGVLAAYSLYRNEQPVAALVAGGLTIGLAPKLAAAVA